MRFKCLILDHDDTAVHSTADIHYPAHIKTMEKLRPGVEVISLEGWFLKNFHPGIMEYMTDELKFTNFEIEEEYSIWQDFVATRHPEFYPGFIDLVREFKNRGGRVAIVSHSTKEVIQRDYDSVGAGDIPELIFGWHNNENLRKPAPYPIEEILKNFNLKPEEALIIDDLKPAVIMSRNTGVPVAGAGWGHRIPEIIDYMEKNCHFYLKELDDLRALIFP
ncbi:MAG: HAD hydrolase-like protein [Spirochaetales bacterium]|nr:HAD hydrolase-like protein [Spirochaetales bacterium]